MKTVVGLFETQAAAEEAVNALIAAGYTNDQIGVSLRGETRAASASSNDPLLADTGHTQPSDSAAVGGYSAGAVIGGTLGVLAAGASAILLPGIGILAAGPIATALGGGLAGAGLGAAVGGLTGGMSQQDATSEAPDVYAEVLQYGGVILTVETEAERADQVQALFAQHGAVDTTSRRPSQTRDANEAAVQEADATDKPAVRDIADTKQSGGEGSTVATPAANTPLASDATVAATKPSGLASLEPGTQPTGAATAGPQTNVVIPASDSGTTVASGAQPAAAAQPDAPAPTVGQAHAAYLSPADTLTASVDQADLQAVATAAGRARRSRTYGMSAPASTAEPAERDLTVSAPYGGAMEVPTEE